MLIPGKLYRLSPHGFHPGLERSVMCKSGTSFKVITPETIFMYIKTSPATDQGFTITDFLVGDTICVWYSRRVDEDFVRC